MRDFVMVALAILLLLPGCGQTHDSGTSIVGTWEQMSFKPRSSFPPTSIDDSDPVSFVLVTFRSDGAFTARYEMEGAVTSIIGTWRTAPDWSAKNNRSSFRIRIGMINGKPSPREAREHGTEAYLTSTNHLFFPMGVDPATGGFKETWGELWRP